MLFFFIFTNFISSFFISIMYFRDSLVFFIIDSFSTFRSGIF